MADKLFLELVSPEKVLVSEEVDEVVALGQDGQVGILPGHAPFFTTSRAGGLSYKIDQTHHHVFITNGFFEVSDDKVVVLAEGAEAAHDIDISKAQELVNRMRDVLSNGKGVNADEAAEAQAIIDQELERLAVAANIKSQ